MTQNPSNNYIHTEDEVVIDETEGQYSDVEPIISNNPSILKADLSKISKQSNKSKADNSTEKMQYSQIKLGAFKTN